MMIYMISGNKGGVGKSMMASVMIDHLLSSKKQVLLIDADMHNPDVFKPHVNNDGVTTHAIDLSRSEGWIDLVNLLDQDREKCVVINTPAGSNQGVMKHGSTLTAALPELGQKLQVLWVINRNRDSLEALREFRDSQPSWPVTIVRNNHYGDADKFELFNKSKLRGEIEAAGGQVIDLPDLADRVSDQLAVERLSIAAADNKMNLGNRMELQRWRAACHKALEAV